MGWSIGYDEDRKRDIGYGVPAFCDFPGCGTKIDRGLSYVCGGDAHGGERGCGLFFCTEHLHHSVALPQLCIRCLKRRKPFPPMFDHPEWMNWKIKDPSWKKWREENPEEVTEIKRKLDIL